MTEGNILKEIELSNSEYKLYKLRQMTTTELRNLYQSLLGDDNLELIPFIKIIMNERNSNL